MELQNNFQRLVLIVLQHEDGYAKDKNDRGGETNFGISKRSYPDEDIKGMTKARAIEIYRQDYWVPSQSPSLPAWLQGIHFDTAVNCGLTRAAKILQHAGAVDEDGKIGPKTLAAAKNVSLNRYASARLAWYDRIIAADPSQVKYRKGWSKRTLSWTK